MQNIHSDEFIDMIINNYLIINHALEHISSHRDEPKCAPTTNFSRTFRNTQLLRKLDKQTIVFQNIKLKPLTKSQSLICLKTPIYDVREKKVELANQRLGKRMKRQAACQTRSIY